ncbi:Omp28 family outer membrane lipoprotein [Lentimicrobium sp.]|uniref:Omp28 family outer membrane lipoprotein n=1 Tax=Lentimicrobium sp. TaxID=2034841 RepID=UPI002B6F20B6|nr:Omp28 family outer membrane lipoprotein [Lentimicrobium sp.]HRW70335.1 Omp28 family outer membrane lipoprotein [Lentimicrobium sp.]
MKISIKAFIGTVLLLSGIALISSCDKIEEPFTKKTGSLDTAACPVPEFPAVTAVQKRVLLEDYTGHTCVNCPKAAKLAHDLKEVHGDKLVLLAVHAGYFANPTPGGDFTYDFRTEAGTAWDVFFGVGMVGNPNGMVNRRGHPNNHIITPTAWGANVTDALSTQPLLDLQMINDYDAAERKLCTHIKTRFITTLDRNLRLVVVLAENGIVKPQKNNDPGSGDTPVIEEYVHNHVLRSAITSTWGSSIAVAGTPNPESLVKSFKYILKEEYVPENCSVIAFVYDDDTKEVLQAIEVDVI